jgi:hypothetical protein
LAHRQEIKERARALWEDGWTPTKVIDKLDEEFHMVENLGSRVKYTTLASWAVKGGWKYFVDHDTPKELNPNQPFGVSGINDPVYHLSLVLGKRLVRENSGTRSNSKEYGSRPSVIVARVLADVDREYDPGPRTLVYLKPILTRYVNTIRRAALAGRENRLNEDPQRNRKSQNRLDEAGIPKGEQEKGDEIPEKFWPLLEAQGWQPPTKEVDDE